MDLAEYLFRSHTESKEIASLIDCNACTVSNIKMRNNSPCLIIALKLLHISEDKIKLEDLLSYEDLVKFKEWKSTLK